MRFQRICSPFIIQTTSITKSVADWEKWRNCKYSKFFLSIIESCTLKFDAWTRHTFLFAAGCYCLIIDLMILILAFLCLIRIPLGVVFCILDFVCQNERKWNVCDHYWLDYCCRRRGSRSSLLLTVERVFVALSIVDYTLHYDAFLIVLSSRGSCVGLLVLGDGDTVVDETDGKYFADDHTLDSKPIWSSWPVGMQLQIRLQVVALRAYLSLMVGVEDSIPTM